ncbi:hypothetical protein [Pseudonocardia sp. DLS-67]
MTTAWHAPGEPDRPRGVVVAPGDADGEAPDGAVLVRWCGPGQGRRWEALRDLVCDEVEG